VVRSSGAEGRIGIGYTSDWHERLARPTTSPTPVKSGFAVQSALEGEPGVDRVIVPGPSGERIDRGGISDAEVERLAPLADAAADQPACQMNAF
jgi:hypothetical protein